MQNYVKHYELTSHLAKQLVKIVNLHLLKLVTLTSTVRLNS